jgi:hypothetical protein
MTEQLEPDIRDIERHDELPPDEPYPYESDAEQEAGDDDEPVT